MLFIYKQRKLFNKTQSENKPKHHNKLTKTGEQSLKKMAVYPHLYRQIDVFTVLKNHRKRGTNAVLGGQGKLSFG